MDEERKKEKDRKNRIEGWRKKERKKERKT